MESKTVQMIFVALNAVGLIGVIICCALPEWTVVHHNTEVHAGLWKMCVKQGTGPQECVSYDSLVPITSEIQACRALTIISCILCGLSLLLLIFGSDFTPCVQNQDAKPKMILAAGVGLLLTGLLVIIPVSWETHNSRNAAEGVVGVKVGASIYIGFIAGLMLMLIGGLLCYLIRSRRKGGIFSFFSNRA